MKLGRVMLEIWPLFALVLGGVVAIGWGMNVLGIPLGVQIIFEVLFVGGLGNWIGLEMRELRREAEGQERATKDPVRDDAR